MKQDSRKLRSLPMPAQRPGIPRQAEASGWLSSGGVEASKSCGQLAGPARALCYLNRGISGF